MKTNLNVLTTQDVASTEGSLEMTISPKETATIFKFFTSYIYSNPIGSIVREITSNSFDSHIEAKINAPILIKKWVDKETNTIYISFIDFGVGMSPERITKEYSVYFNSTKRADNTQIGGFGIGGKTPLAYRRKYGLGENEYDNSYEIITIFNGLKYTYQVYETKKAPAISDPAIVPTTEHNGTEIRIPVLERDVSTFEKELVRQLYYFENIIFEGFEKDHWNENNYESILTNKYKIIRSKTFLYRGTDYSNYMHVCLGKVAYPIDYNVLNLSSGDYNIPIAIRVEIGEIGVTAGRETLDYSENTIKVLQKKLEEARNEIKEMLAKQYSNIVTLEDYFNVKNQFGTLQLTKTVSLNVDRLIAQKDIDFSNFKYSFLKMPNDKQLFRFFFNVKVGGKKNKWDTNGFDGSYTELCQKNPNVLYVESDFKRKIIKNAYLKEKYTKYYVIEKSLDFMLCDIANLFNVHLDKTTDDNGKPVPFVQSLYDMQEEFFDIIRKNATDYDSLVVSADFIEDRKKTNIAMSKHFRNITIPVNFACHNYRSRGTNRIKLDTLFNYNQPIFYGTQEQHNELKKIYDIYVSLFDKDAPIISCYHDGSLYNNYRRKEDKSKKSIMFIILAKNNIQYMAYCKKAYKPEEFFQKLLYRKEDKVMSYFQTYDLKEKWDCIDSKYKYNTFNRISADWGKKIKKVNDYIDSLPSVSNSNIGDMKTELSKYFDLSKIKMTGEQKSIEKLIVEISKLERDNRGILRFIDFHYEREINEPVLIDILKKVMVL